MRRGTFNLMVLGTVALLAAAAPRDAGAVLAHRYSFNGNANDSVGTMHGTVIDAGVPTAVFAGGQLDLSANTGQPSNGITEDAYVDFPNGLITDVATSGTSGAFSIEMWATIAEQHTWMRFVDFGTSDGGEDTSGGAPESPYVYLAANSGRFTNGLATEVHVTGGELREVGITGPAPIGTQIHLVGTYDQNDLSAGTNGTFKLYNNGALVGATAVPQGMDLNAFTNNNNWLGRSQWPDPVFDGQFNELRLYNSALTASEVGANSILGPDTVGGAIITLEVNKSTGAVKLTNSTTQTLNLDFYRISSAGNALSVANWNSLDDQNFAAIDGPDAGSVAGDSPGEGFDESGAVGAGQLVEYYLGASGAALTAGQTLNLGSAFNTSIFGAGNNGDLQMTFGLVGGLQINGTVTYVTGGPAGDFNNDGRVNGADFLVWQRGGSPNPLSAADLAAWKANYGAAVGAAGAVPEPTTVGLVAAAAACLAVARRRKS